jgi:hypothetical protein
VRHADSAWGWIVWEVCFFNSFFPNYSRRETGRHGKTAPCARAGRTQGDDGGRGWKTSSRKAAKIRF